MTSAYLIGNLQSNLLKKLQITNLTFFQKNWEFVFKVEAFVDVILIQINFKDTSDNLRLFSEERKR